MKRIDYKYEDNYLWLYEGQTLIDIIETNNIISHRKMLRTWADDRDGYENYVFLKID